MRDDEIRRALTDANPWWRARSGADPDQWTASHRLLRDRAGYDLGYRSDALADLVAAPVGNTLTVLTGPRRAGKSVALIDAAAAFCRRDDVDARQVVHLACDGMRDRDLRRALTLGRELTRSVDRPDPLPRVWLLDEVSTVSGWSEVLKAARDGTAFGDDTVVATGSRWPDGAGVVGNLLAGRAGTSDLRRVRQLLPMSFRDFVTSTRPELARPPCVHPAELQSPQAAEALDELRYDVDGYDLAWQDYLTCGGLPRAVAEHVRNGAVSISYLRDLEAWLRRDTDPDGPPESVPLLLAGLVERAGSPLSVAGTARSLGYPSRAVLERRLGRLVATFAALWCPQRDDAGRTVAGSVAKLYLIDPLLAWLPAALRSGMPAPDMTVLSEMALGVALARAVERLDEGRWLGGDTIGYLRTGSGNEIDLAPVQVPTGSGIAFAVGLESKWVDSGWRAEARVIEARYRRGIVATKSVLDLDHAAWAVPAPMVALLLG